MNAKEELTKLLMESYDQGVKDTIQAGLATLAKMVADEREACAQIVNDDRGLSDDDAIRVCRTIRARGQE
jgi:hypothetical protein